jgi:N-acetylneuraminic acid mutarotase
MNIARTAASATLLHNGKVLVTGGADAPGTSLVWFTSAELYDPLSNTWTDTGSMSVARFNHTATLLLDGRVLVAGGQPNTAAAEVYDPRSGVWSVTGSMSVGREGHTATRLLNGEVLVSGGSVGFGPVNPVTTSELYDPRSGTWHQAGNMMSARYRHAATHLPNGEVLVSGGVTDGAGDVTVSAELYDPASNTWSSAGDMTSPRMDHTLTSLLDGKVLATAGASTTSGTYLATAETTGPTSEKPRPHA